MTKVTTDLASYWTLDPGITFLNHGSFGACPRPVLAMQQELRERMEREPVLFLDRHLEAMMDEARGRLGTWLGADADDLAFVPNATTGVNTVLRSLRFSPGDELLTTTHAYGACRNALDEVGRQSGAKVVVADVPFPIHFPEEVLGAVLERVTPRTKLAMLDHVTAPTGLVFPIEDLVEALASRGVDTLVDGAHAPGMVGINLERLQAAYYTGNCHKWLSAPKGAAFLHVRKDKQEQIRPLVISHGATSSRKDRSRFRLEFDWTGTSDPTPYLCIPSAIDFFANLLPGGWREVEQRNHKLALEARRILREALGVAVPAPVSMLGSLAAIPLPGDDEEALSRQEGLGSALFNQYGIEVPVFAWPGGRNRILRVSAQLYNRPEQYEKLAKAVGELLS